MKARNPMKRTGFKRNALAPAAPQNREQRLAERAQRSMSAAKATTHLATTKSVVVMGSATSGIAILKTDALESVAYRKVVAALPCQWCGISGYSQHAHLNLGKGLGLKTDDRTGFPLCCTRPGVEGCHMAYDQYRLIEVGGREAHREYGQEWGRITRHTIEQAGQWPKNLPMWQERESDAG